MGFRYRRKSIGFDELSFFNRQLASMARLDLPFAEGLKSLAQEVDGAEFRRMIRGLLEDLEEGHRLSEALEKQDHAFSDLYIGVVRAGEKGGDLAAALEGLANYSESMLYLRQRLRSTMAYPTVALIASLGMIMFIFTALIPRFETIYEAMDIQLPALTRFFIGSAAMVHDNLSLVGGGILCLIALVFILRRVRMGAHALRQFALNLPFYGRLLRQVLLLRFCETLRALLRSNVSLVPALDLTARTLGDNMVRLTVMDMKAAAEEGRRVSDVLRRNSIFPRTFVWKFALAEEQGNLEKTLDELCRHARLELKTVTSRFSTLLEPFLIAIVGILVGGMVISIFLPIFDLQARLR